GLVALAGASLIGGCTSTQANAAANEHAGHDSAAPSASVSVPASESLPADAAGARARLASSPRHGEWVTYKSGADSIRAWLVYPQRKDKAPVVVVIHEIYGLTPWV